MVETEDYIVIVPLVVSLILLYEFIDLRTLAEMTRAPAALVEYIRPPLEALVQSIGSLFW